uniref:Uncharacterized mitochondrial protein AtMg00810-like n=1 Tax=Tanacetum cinerariifolium TaxID=118510 RepID=A0A699HA39_TANCI|nr:uncharacterized mitochondrial protein AtMg00810-like [Tanacetum cinerariifolium]
MKNSNFQNVGFTTTPIDTEKPSLKDPDGEDVDVHTYRSMIGSLMYLTSSRPDIMFVVCACARFQVTPKASHLHTVKRIFRCLKSKPHLGLWYPKDLTFNLVAYSDSDYAGASLDRKSTTGRCQFLGCRLISWQCKKQTVVATSSTKAEYVAATSCCAQVLWIQNQLLDYGPDQMVFGKDSSNPLMADNLSKTVWYSTHRVALMKSWLVQKQMALEGIDCLPNEEIFTELARMGYEKPSTKLTIYKAFFSSQWKFLIHTILQCISAKRTSWNEFSSFMASAVICLSTGVCQHEKGRKGLFGVDTPLFEGMLVAQQVAEGVAELNVDDVPAAGVADEGVAEVNVDVVPAAVDEPSIPSPKPPTQPPPPS